MVEKTFKDPSTVVKVTREGGKAVKSLTHRTRMSTKFETEKKNVKRGRACRPMWNPGAGVARVAAEDERDEHLKKARNPSRK